MERAGALDRARVGGALIGGLIFRLLGIWPGLEEISISLRDIVAAFIGSLIFLLIVWFVKERRGAGGTGYT